MIFEYDPILEKIVQNMRRSGKELLEIEKAKRANPKEQLNLVS